MTTVVLYITTSVDGFIARENGDIDWLSIVDSDGEDYGYNKFYQSVDALVMGSRTYQQILSFGDWPYPGKPSYVMTSGVYTSDNSDIEFISNDVWAANKIFHEAQYRCVWLVGGGRLASAFHQAGLIDQYIISLIPAVLGKGIPLFSFGGSAKILILEDFKRFPSGLVQLKYLGGENVPII